MADRWGKIFNRDVRLSKGSQLVVNDIVIVDGNGNIDAPVTTTNVTASGNLSVAGTSSLTGKVTADDIDLASGAVIAGLGTGANGIVLKNLKNAAASALSGTQRDIQIDIGGTPYYFTVYPTKA